MDSSKLTQVCVICGQPYEGYGHNAQPIADGECCDKCNRLVVIPARLQEFTENYID